MLIRLHLAQCKPDVDPNTLLTALQKLHSLREEWSGVIDITIGKTTSSDYPYAAVLRYVEPPLSISIVQAQPYQEVLTAISALCANMLTFDLSPETDTLGKLSPIAPAFGLFSPTIEERLRNVIALWFQGTGQALLPSTKLLELPGDESGLDLANFDRAIEEEFGIKDIIDILGPKVTFGDVLWYIEQKS